MHGGEVAVLPCITGGRVLYSPLLVTTVPSTANVPCCSMVKGAEKAVVAAVKAASAVSFWEIFIVFSPSD
jgi:hypothetical protein